LDALGREVEDPDPDANSSFVNDRGEPLTRDEAFARVWERVSSLARDMSDADLSQDGIALDDPRFGQLNGVSNGARSVRQKLVQSLELVQSAEDELKAKYGSLRASMKKSTSGVLPNVISRSRYPLNVWIFTTVVFLQVALIVFMYRMSHAKARHLFLTNYYDPFNPDLHLHITKPSAYRHSMDQSPPWSIFGVPATFSRSGLGGVCSELWGNVTIAVSDWQRATWEAWGEHERTIAWPPT